MPKKKLSPIVLFVYNRPLHAQKTLEALEKNEAAKDSLLYVFADGPKQGASPEQIDLIAQTRNEIRKKKWCQEVKIVESKKNKGLAESIISGVSEVIDKHERIIVLEDDLVTSPCFLNYMNQGLEFYDGFKSVFSVCADRPPYSKLIVPENYPFDVFVSLRSFSTGWATWKDRWKKVDWSCKSAQTLLENPHMVKAFNRGGDDLSNLINLQLENKIDSWAIRFQMAHFIHHAVAILPCNSYIDNIGFDGTGTHSGANDAGYRKDVSLAANTPRFLDIIYQDDRIINSFYNGYTAKKRPVWQKAVNRISRMMGRGNVFEIKKKVFV